MNFFFLVYICLTSVMVLFIIPFVLICVIVTGRYKNLVFQRLGVYPRLSHLKKHRIWLHAVSVGEVNVARALIDALFQMHSDIDIILSTTTPRGYELACKMSHPRVQCVYSPIDFIASVRLAFHKIQPDILVLLETEIWPNWIFTAKALNVPVVVANGRISMKTVNSFQKIAPLVRFIVRKIDAFSMISTEDAHRICKTGVSPKKVFVTGNAKFDLLEKNYSPQLSATLRNDLRIHASNFVMVAGSTRTGEEEIVLEVYQSLRKEYPDALCIIAPRHIERCSDIEGLFQKFNMAYDRYSWCKHMRYRRKPVVLVDTIGDLAGLYSIGSVVFCGGSLVPQGGQNVLEPAVWGKPVLYGPYMDDFLWARNVLESGGGGIMVSNGMDLLEKVLFFASNKDRALSVGQKARQSVIKRAGAAKGHAQIILNVANHF